MLNKVNDCPRKQLILLFLFRMNRYRLNPSVMLMLLAITTLVCFQVWWLYRNFREEQDIFSRQAFVLFREAVYQSQVAGTEAEVLPQSVLKKIPGALDVVAGRLRDSGITKQPVFKNIPGGVATARIMDSPRIQLFMSNQTSRATSLPADGRAFLQVLRSGDSLYYSVSVDTIIANYKRILKREGLNFSFLVKKYQKNLAIGDSKAIPRQTNIVTLGFEHPVSYQLVITGNQPYLLKKIWPRLLLSFLLVALTIFSFILLYRDFIKQKKLTDIKNEFISNITHELKTPIATVSVAVEALKNFNALDNPTRTREYLDISGHELQRLSLLVDKVLKLSMFEKQQIELNPQVLSLDQLARDVINTMQLQLDRSHATVVQRYEGDNFEIQADPLHLTSIVFNLLDNALKYGGDTPAITVSIKDLGASLELQVADKGIGIAPEYREKIFEKFFRVPAGDRHNTKGYGLGLSYIAYVVKLHQGTIEVDSEPGKGSCFIIKLPKAI